MSETDNLTLEQAEELLAGIAIPDNVRQDILSDVRLSNAIRERLETLAGEMADGRAITNDELAEEIDRVAVAHGVEGGVPIPTRNFHPVVMAQRSKLGWILENSQYRTEAEGEAVQQGYPVINSWEQLGDRTIMVVPTTNGPYFMPQYHSGIRLRKIIKTISIRHDAIMEASAELKAVESLKSKINGNQFASYVLTGMFLERSPRSDLHYIFRKGFPTIVLSFHGSENARVIACLCMHPVGYYQGTHCGIMAPTDEVISHLAMMRSDERRFWAKSGQWHASDPRSGI